MRALAALVLTLVGCSAAPPPPDSRPTFYGYECTDDCSGHDAGWEWAENHGAAHEDDCPDGNSESFHEGCLAYVQESGRDDYDYER